MSNPKHKRFNLADVERAAWRSGLLATALLLPLDRLPEAVARPFLWLSLGLLLVRPMYQLRAPAKLWRRLTGRRELVVSLVLGAVGAAAWASVPGALDPTVAGAAALTLSWLLFRAWLIAIWSDWSDLVTLAKWVIGVGLVVVVLGWLQAAADLAGWPSSLTGLLPRYSHTATFVVPRPQATALEPLYLAHYLFIPLGLLLALWLGRWQRRLVSVAIVAVMSLMLATGSRGGLLGLVAVGLLTGLAWLWNRPGGRKVAVSLAVTGTLTLIVLGVTIWRQYRDQPVAQNVKIERTWQSALGHYLDFNDRSANTRYELWPAAIEQWHRHPVLGVGLYNSRLAIHEDAWRTGTPIEQLQPLNNDYLAWLAETGLVGLTALLALASCLVVAGYRAWQQWQPWTSGWSLAVAGMAVQALTFHSILLLRTWVVVGAILAVWVSRRRTP